MEAYMNKLKKNSVQNLFMKNLLFEVLSFFCSCGDTEETVDGEDVSHPGNALSPLDEDSSLESERIISETITHHHDKDDERDSRTDVEPGKLFLKIFFHCLLIVYGVQV